MFTACCATSSGQENELMQVKELLKSTYMLLSDRKTHETHPKRGIHQTLRHTLTHYNDSTMCASVSLLTRLLIETVSAIHGDHQ